MFVKMDFKITREDNVLNLPSTGDDHVRRIAVFAIVDLVGEDIDIGEGLTGGVDEGAVRVERDSPVLWQADQ